MSTGGESDKYWRNRWKSMNIAKGDLAWHNIFIIEHKINKITTLICKYKRMRDIVFWKWMDI